MHTLNRSSLHIEMYALVPDAWFGQVKRRVLRGRPQVDLCRYRLVVLSLSPLQSCPPPESRLLQQFASPGGELVPHAPQGDSLLLCVGHRELQLLSRGQRRGAAELCVLFSTGREFEVVSGVCVCVRVRACSLQVLSHVTLFWWWKSLWKFRRWPTTQSVHHEAQSM